MKKIRKAKQVGRKPEFDNLIVRVPKTLKKSLFKAAGTAQMSASEYVRASITLALAKHGSI